MADILTPDPPPQTLQTLTDLIAAIQREVNDLEVIIMGHTQQIGVHTVDIDVLQDPPAGVPPPLLDWYGMGHTTKEVDTLLSADLDTLFASSASNADTINQVSNRLDQEVTDRSTNDNVLSNTDTDLQGQITSNLDTLVQEIADRSALSVTVSDQYDSANTRMDNIESDLAAQSSAGDSAASSASSQIDTINQALQVAQTQILQLQGVGVDPAGAQASQITALTIIANNAATATALETTNRTNADLVLQSSINALNSSIFGIQSGLSAEVSTRAAADAAHDTEIGALEASVAGSVGAIGAETAARVAADSAHDAAIAGNTSSIAANSAAITTEISDRATADTGLQAQITTNTTNIGSNSTGIAANTADIGGIKAQFSVVKDDGGYVTDWQVIDQTAPPGDFHLKNLNNNARLTAPGYPDKFFPPVSAAVFSPPNLFDADYNGTTANDFQGIDTNNYTRPVKVANTLTVAPNASIFMGVDNSVGGNFNRLGQVLTTFVLDFSGYVNKNLSVWYRIKNTSSDNTQRWLPGAWAGVSIPSPRTYEFTRGQAIVQISVPTDKVIEFGLTVLHTLNASIDNAAYDAIYDGSLSVTALNMVTIS